MDSPPFSTIRKRCRALGIKCSGAYRVQLTKLRNVERTIPAEQLAILHDNLDLYLALKPAIEKLLMADPNSEERAQFKSEKWSISAIWARLYDEILAIEKQGDQFSLNLVAEILDDSPAAYQVINEDQSAMQRFLTNYPTIVALLSLLEPAGEYIRGYRIASGEIPEEIINEEELNYIRDYDTAFELYLEFPHLLTDVTMIDAIKDHDWGFLWYLSQRATEEQKKAAISLALTSDEYLGALEIFLELGFVPTLDDVINVTKLHQTQIVIKLFKELNNDQMLTYFDYLAAWRERSSLDILRELLKDQQVIHHLKNPYRPPDDTVLIRTKKHKLVDDAYLIFVRNNRPSMMQTIEKLRIITLDWIEIILYAAHRNADAAMIRLVRKHPPRNKKKLKWLFENLGWYAWPTLEILLRDEKIVRLVNSDEHLLSLVNELEQGWQASQEDQQESSEEDEA